MSLRPSLANTIIPQNQPLTSYPWKNILDPHMIETLKEEDGTCVKIFINLTENKNKNDIGKYRITCSVTSLQIQKACLIIYLQQLYMLGLQTTETSTDF